MQTAAEAAFEFLHIEATKGVGAAISFALDYEDKASSEDYAEYLDILETKLRNVHLPEIVRALITKAA